jgi:hypothetical protein
MQFLPVLACELRGDMTKRVSCGFDLRVNADLQETDPRQWDQFLLGRDKRSLISADTRVWSVPDDVDSLLQDSIRKFWNPLGLSKDLDMLLSACRELSIPVAGLLPVCLTVTEELVATLVKWSGPEYFDNAPSEDDLLSTGWRFLGLDVVELNGLTSGLKGIGYKEPSLSELRKRFGGALNEVGLFSDESIAAEFAKARGIEIPSHAPFDVVGILVHDPISQ